MCLVHNALSTSTLFDDILFRALLLTGFHALMRLGELVWPDSVDLRDPRALAQHRSVAIDSKFFSFLLPTCKTNRIFEGNKIIVRRNNSDAEPWTTFKSYVAARDRAHPWHPHLWLRSTGEPPTRSWFIKMLRKFFPSNIAGHSMRSGGATVLAERGCPPQVIQACGRWTSDAWEAYVRKHPVLLQAFLFDRQQSQQLIP